MTAPIHKATSQDILNSVLMPWQLMNNHASKFLPCPLPDH